MRFAVADGYKASQTIILTQAVALAVVDLIVLLAINTGLAKATWKFRSEVRAFSFGFSTGGVCSWKKREECTASSF